MSDITFGSAGISAAAALSLTEAAMQAARRRDRPVSIAVVDQSGLLKAFARMDGASVLSLDISIDKAWTAAANGMPTHAWRELLDTEPAVAQIAHRPRLTAFAGGVPLTVDGQLVGGLGVSGAHHTEDREIAQAALEALGSRADQELQGSTFGGPKVHGEIRRCDSSGRPGEAGKLMGRKGP